MTNASPSPAHVASQEHSGGRVPRSGVAVGVVAILHGLGCLVLRPVLFYVAPYPWSPTAGLVAFLILSVCFVLAGAFATRGRPWAYVTIVVACLFASFQYISPEFAYSFMGPLFIKMGSGVTSAQPWVNVNLLPFVLAFFASRNYHRLKKEPRVNFKRVA